MTASLRSVSLRLSRSLSTQVLRSSFDTAQMARFNLLIDLNGTCHIGDASTPGAIEAIRKLRSAQQQYPSRLNLRFCSNTSKESSTSLLQRLRRVGLDEELVSAQDVFTSLDAAYRYVARRQLRPMLLLSPSAQNVFKEDSDLAQTCFFASAGSDPKMLSPEDAKKLRSCNAVVLGLCPELMTQKWLDEAFRLLSGEYGASQQVALIATHRGTYTSTRALAAPSLTNNLSASLGYVFQPSTIVRARVIHCLWVLERLLRHSKLHLTGR